MLCKGVLKGLNLGLKNVVLCIHACDGGLQRMPVWKRMTFQAGPAVFQVLPAKIVYETGIARAGTQGIG